MVSAAPTAGLKKADAIYLDRTIRIRELKKDGKKVIGYLCIYPVVEMLTALDLVPYRIMGDICEPITTADTCLPAMVCPFLRSVMDLGLKGKYGFLDGAVFAHPCEVAEKMGHIWRTKLDLPYLHFIDTPHSTHEAAIRQHKALLEEFRQTLETYAGKKLTVERLQKAVGVHNKQRNLVKELYDLRKPDPPLVSGTDTLKVIVALMSLPVEEGNTLLREVITQVKERPNPIPKQSARLLVWGSILDNIGLIDMIELSGANVVMDDTCVGSRAYFAQVETTKDPLDGLAYRYLVDLKCPRTFRPPILKGGKKDYATDLENRFGYLKQFARDWKVNGVVLQALRYCDIHAYEVPALREYLDSIGLPNIYLEHEYSEAALSQLKTRIQAFLEVIG